MNRHTILAICFVSLGMPAVACSVPVFRYALENWEPDRLTVAVIHNGEISGETKALVDRMDVASAEADDKVNLRTHPIDVSVQHSEGSAEAQHADQWKGKKLPQMLVYFSNNTPEPQLTWSAELTESNVDLLLDSPARKTIVQRLLDGQSAVWVLLKTGNKSADERAEKMLQEELAKKPNEIELPSLTDLATEEKFNEELGVEMRVEFSIVTIDPDDQQETFFRQMLINTESDLKDFDDPIAIPIYGRGRTYFALVGPGITADNIADNCNFLCGACSCEVKRDNPGQDLLLAANWNQVEPGNWVNDTPLPALTGIGGFEGLVDDSESPPIVDSVTEIETNTDDKLLAALDHASSGAAQLDVNRQKATSVKSVAANSSTDKVTIPSEDATSSSAQNGIMLIGGWAALLFCLGLVFTVWQRRRSSE